MGLFKSKREKTCDALENLLKESADEAKGMYDTALQELKNAGFEELRNMELKNAGLPETNNEISKQAIRLRKINEYFAYMLDLDHNLYHGEGAYARAHNDMVYGIWRHYYLYYIYLCLVILKLQQTDDKNLSKEAIMPLLQSHSLLDYVRPFSPAGVYDKTEDFIVQNSGLTSYSLDVWLSPNRIRSLKVELF